jgi:hypothetical protein
MCAGPPFGLITPVAATDCDASVAMSVDKAQQPRAAPQTHNTARTAMADCHRDFLDGLPATRKHTVMQL